MQKISVMVLGLVVDLDIDTRGLNPQMKFLWRIIPVLIGFIATLWFFAFLIAWAAGELMATAPSHGVGVLPIFVLLYVLFGVVNSVRTRH